MTLRRTGYYLTAIAASLAMAGQAHATACLNTQEVAAEQVRLLQTQMMVGALQCRGQSDRGQRVIYNRFIKAYGPELIASNDTLIAYFQRAYGAGYQRQMDSHITAMANRISLESQKIGNFCGKIANLGEQVLADKTQTDLQEIATAAPLSKTLSSQSCVADPLGQVISTD